MFNVGYFTIPGITSGGGGSSGTGLTTEQTKQLTDLATWATSTSHTGDLAAALGEVVRSTQIQASVYKPPYPSGSIDYLDASLVVQSDVIQAMLTDKTYTDNTVANVVSNAVANKVEFVTEEVTNNDVAGMLVSSDATIKPNRTYVCYPTELPMGNFGWIRFRYPTNDALFEFRVVNRTTVGYNLRVWVNNKDDDYNLPENGVGFRRKGNVNAHSSCAAIEPYCSMRFLFVPKRWGIFHTQGGVPLPGFLELDDPSETSRSILPLLAPP
jgi:hypothetical protein